MARGFREPQPGTAEQQIAVPFSLDFPAVMRLIFRGAWLLEACFSLCALALGAASLIAETPVRILAFGDSITLGFGDSGSNPAGYPGRLEQLLEDEGYEASVENFGVGGETTAEGLSRIDSVLATGGQYLLLMEGTNDISRGISVETIRFNLDQMARRAENAKLVVVHATVIPRAPWATVDATNTLTAALASAVRSLAELRGRPLADPFSLFQSLPNVFTNYYFNDPLDPVGHPNSAGYTKLAGLFFETLLPLLENPRIRILPPSENLFAGTEVTFGLFLSGYFDRIEWDFGDLGFSTSTPPHPSLVSHIYLEPDFYTVNVRGTTPDGRVAIDRVSLVVEGIAQSWFARSALLPIAISLNSGSATDVTTRLEVQNLTTGPALVEVTLFPDIHYDEPPPQRRIYLRAGSTVSIPEALTALFGRSSARGAILLMYLAPASGSLVQLASEGRIALRSSGDTNSDAEIEEIRSSSWDATKKRIQNIELSPGSDFFLVVSNLDLNGGYFLLEVRDRQDVLVGQALLEVDPFQSRWRNLRDLFRGLDARPRPFRLEVQSSGPRFTAFGILVDPIGGGVFAYPGTP